MAVFYYPPGMLSSGFCGCRAVTTVGSEEDYRQEWFSLSDYDEATARRKAYAKNSQWRREADAIADEKKLGYQHWKGLSDIPGLNACLNISRKFRGGEYRRYISPMFTGYVMINKRRQTNSFRISPGAGRDYLEAWEEACRWYIKVRGLPPEALEHLIDIMPDPSYFYEYLYDRTEGASELISRQDLIKKVQY